jgi:bacillithiol system protein YtxJ
MIAQRLDVVHESPQLIVIKNGKTLESASHENINNLLLSEFLN